MSSKLFVGGLDWNVSSEELGDLFAGLGSVVEAKVINDRDTGRSRGFGFVTMSSADEAKRAIDEFDGTNQFGRSIKVNLADDKPKGRGNGGRGGGNSNRW